MSRAVRRYRKWEAETRQHAWEDARRLALDLHQCRPGGISPYGIGVVLDPGEIVYRQVWVRYYTLGTTPDLLDQRGRFYPGMPSWRDWGLCTTLVTSYRLVTRVAGDSGRLISNWWAQIAGVQIDLDREMVTMDDRVSEWRGAYVGPAAPIIAVAAVGRIHGSGALLDHPALRQLRSHTASRTGTCRIPISVTPL